MKNFKDFVSEEKVSYKKGQEVSFTDSTSGKKVTGKFVKHVNKDGHKYVHVETGTQAHYVPTHQMHK